jgi:hypothetical protein
VIRARTLQLLRQRPQHRCLLRLSQVVHAHTLAPPAGSPL